MSRITESLIFMFAVYFVQSENDGICHPEKPNKCCAQFYLVKGSCLPCNGSFGVHCSSSCPRRYCGYQCSIQCPCDDCDKKTCVCGQTSNDDRSAAPRRFKYELLISLGIGLIVSGISLVALICWISKREKRPLEVNCSDLTQENYVEYDMIRESQLIVDDDDDDDNDDDDDLKIHTVQPCNIVDKHRRLSLDDKSEGGFYNELRYNS